MTPWFLSVLVSTAAAHPLAPEGVTFDVRDDGIHVAWSRPVTHPGPPSTLVWPADCVVAMEGTTRQHVQCATPPASVDVAVDAPAGVFARTMRDGADRGVSFFDAPGGALPLPGPLDPWPVVRTGMTAFLGRGLPILLVAAMVVGLGWTRRLGDAAVGLSFGLSAVLAAAWWGGLAVSGPFVQGIVAASVVWTAWQATASDDDPPGLLERHPAIVGLVLGAVHGVGIATGRWAYGLHGLGAPGELVYLFMGVDLALVGVVAVLWGVARAWPRGTSRWRLPLGWALGALAASWLWVAIGRGLALAV